MATLETLEANQRHIIEELAEIKDTLKEINGCVRGHSVEIALHKAAIAVAKKEVEKLRKRQETIGWLDRGLIAILTSVAAWIGTRY